MKKVSAIVLAVILSLLTIIPTVIAADTEIYYEFANYSMPVICELKGDYPKTEKFNFSVTATPGKGSPNFKSNTIIVPANTEQIFGTVESDKPDTYTYVVSQKVGDVPEIIYDKTEYEVVIDINYNGENAIVENHSITNLTTKEKVEKIRFINIYESQSPDTGDDNALIIWFFILGILCAAAIGVVIAITVTKKRAE